MGVDAHTDLASEIARLTSAIDGAAAATESALRRAAPPPADDDPEQLELRRQLAALRERVALAEHRDEGPAALRAELATLLFFARTLQADADRRRGAVAERIEELERQNIAARQERERLAAERERLAVERDQLARRRDALQLTILQTAARMAQPSRGECRRTVPVFTLGEGLTVCSVSVSCPRRGFRFAKQWLVTLSGSHEVLVRRE